MVDSFRHILSMSHTGSGGGKNVIQDHPVEIRHWQVPTSSFASKPHPCSPQCPRRLLGFQTAESPLASGKRFTPAANMVSPAVFLDSVPEWLPAATSSRWLTSLVALRAEWPISTCWLHSYTLENDTLESEYINSVTYYTAKAGQKESPFSLDSKTRGIDNLNPGYILKISV